MLNNAKMATVKDLLDFASTYGYEPIHLYEYDPEVTNDLIENEWVYSPARIELIKKLMYHDLIENEKNIKKRNVQLNQAELNKINRL